MELQNRVTWDSYQARKGMLPHYVAKDESAIARRLVKNALALGYTVSVYDGEEWAVKRSSKRGEILEALASTDSDVLRFRDKAGAKLGSVALIWGNGSDLISDYSDNREMNLLVGSVID